MKAIFLVVVVLLFGFSSAKPKPAKRDLTCSDFPKQLSGRLYLKTVMDSGVSVTTDMTFNLDMNLQMIQAEIKVNDMDPVTGIMDFKGGKAYVVYQGGCHVSPFDGKLLDPEDLKILSFQAGGKLGLKGTSVALYSGQKDDGHFVLTLESGNQCIPVSIATKENGVGAAATGSFLDLKTTADTEKMKIPEHCGDQQVDSRSIEHMIRTENLKAAVKRGFPWINLHGVQKRGFPWINLQDVRKRAYPWLAMQEARKQ